ncbi:carbon starvation protein A, partial [Bacillus thuringiensis]|nr:carbon starvation protein A [Bacillus thuringiensis]
GKVLAPAKNVAQMKQIIFNDYIDAALCGIFMIVVIAVLISAIRIWIQVLRNKPMLLKEAAYISRDESESRNYYA